MLRRALGALVTAAVAGALVLPVAAGAPAAAPAGSLASWRQGQWWVDASKLKSWHDQGVTGRGVTIALVDGPVFPSIPELVGQDVGPTATLCDREPWRSWGPTTPTGPLNDTSFHTTSMAALLVGSGKGNGVNGVGVLGVAPGATLRTYAIFNTKDPAANQNLDCWGPGYADLIDTIVADGASVIEIPVAIDVGDDAVQAAYNRAFSKGVVIVASSGNGGSQSAVMSPGGNRGVLVVGGTQADGQVADTNPTSLLDSWDQAQRIDGAGNIHLVAPGADLVGGGLTPANQWDSAVLQNGSSGASAIVAGQLALMRQRWPQATGNQLLYSLLRGARRPAGSGVWEPRRGFGTTSFETTLTNDPAGYPDVNPIFHTMAAVFDDHPTAPTMPLQVGGDGLPTGAESAPLAVSGATVATTSEQAWLVWLVGGLLVVASFLGGGWLVTRNRRTGAPATGRAGPEPPR